MVLLYLKGFNIFYRGYPLEIIFPKCLYFGNNNLYVEEMLKENKEFKDDKINLCYENLQNKNVLENFSRVFRYYVNKKFKTSYYLR